MLEERSWNKGYGAHTSVAHPSIFKQRSQPAGTSFWTWSQCADSQVLEWFLSVPNRSTKIMGAHRAKPHLHPDNKIWFFWSQATCSISETTLLQTACTPVPITRMYLLVFQMWTTSGSVIFLLSAWASRKSKKYLMATGALLLGKLQMLLKRFSTTEWMATWKIKKMSNATVTHEKNDIFCLGEPTLLRGTTHTNCNTLVAKI